MADSDNTTQTGTGTAAAPVVPTVIRRVSYNSQTTDREAPFNAFRFLVYIDLSETVSGAFTGFSGAHMRTRMVKARTGDDPRGVQDNIPGITEYEPITLTKGVIGDSDFLNWMTNANFPRWDSSPLGMNKYRDLRIVALNDKGEKGAVWNVKNATPSGYQLKEMDASSSAVLTESIEFSITGIERVYTEGNANKDSVYKAMDRIIRTYEVTPGTGGKQTLVGKDVSAYNFANESAARKQDAYDEWRMSGGEKEAERIAAEEARVAELTDEKKKQEAKKKQAVKDKWQAGEDKAKAEEEKNQIDKDVEALKSKVQDLFTSGEMTEEKEKEIFELEKQRGAKEKESKEKQAEIDAADIKIKEADENIKEADKKIPKIENEIRNPSPKKKEMVSENADSSEGEETGENEPTEPATT